MKVNGITFAGSVLALLAGCSGGGGSSSSPSASAPTPSPAPAFTLSSSTPNGGATNIARSSALQLVFSADLDSATATAGNVSLSGTTGDVPLTLSVSGNQLTATPAHKLLPLSNYTLTLNTGLAGSGNEQLATSQAISFTTTDGNWSTARTIDTGTGSADAPAIATDGNGNAMAVWWSNVGSTGIYANRYMAGSGWGTAEQISSGNGGTTAPQIVMDRNGNALAVWHQYDGTAMSVYANRYTPAGGWGTQQLIETSSDNSDSVQIAMDDDGNAIAIWRQGPGTALVYANRYTPSGGWGTAQQVSIGQVGSFLQVAMNKNGDAVVVWQEIDGSDYNVYANRYTVAGGWDIPELIESGSGLCYHPRVVLDDNGNAMGVWSQNDGSKYSIYANRYTRSGGWGTEQLIETDDNGDADYPNIAVDRDGNVIAVWAQQYFSASYNISTNRYTPGSGWGTAGVLQSDYTYNAKIPSVRFDKAGNAISVWRQFDVSGFFGIYAARYTHSGTWSSSQAIESINKDADLPGLAIDANGDGIAIWKQTDGTNYKIYVNRFE